jgi:hypothetical protein
MRVQNFRLLKKAQRMLREGREISTQVLAALLVAILLNVLLLQPVQAATLDWRAPGVQWTNTVNPPTGTTQTFPAAGTIGNSGVRVRLSLGGDNIVTQMLDPLDALSAIPFNLTGGATPASTIAALINGATNAQSVTFTFDYLDPNNNPVTIENARFVIIDIDTDAGNLWNDQVTAGGTAIPTLLPVTAPIAGLVGAGEIFPLATASQYTPSIVGAVATGQQVPGPGTGDQGNDFTSANNGPNGAVVAAYGDPITSAAFTYGYGPLAPAAPNQQGLGFYNLFFDPVTIGTSKQVTNVVDNGNGTFTVTYQVVVENMGGVELRNVQLVEDLTGTFAAPTTFTVTDVRLIGTNRAGAPAPNISAGFTGVAPNTNLLDGAGTLLPRELDANNNQTAAGGTATIQFDVQITPNGFFGPFNNQVQASGTSPAGTTVTDDSVNGVDPDPNGDGSAVESSLTPVTLTAAPTATSLNLVKRITAVFRGGAELVRYNTFNDQPGTTIDNTLNAATTGAAVNEPVGVFQLPANVGLQTGDQLEYSLYYWNPSTVTNITGISLCDEVQAPATLDTTSLQRSNPFVNATSTALTYVASATVASRAAGAALDAYCPSAPGNFPTGGGVVVPGPFDINAAAPSGQYGSIRFRVNVP